MYIDPHTHCTAIRGREHHFHISAQSTIKYSDSEVNNANIFIHLIAIRIKANANICKWKGEVIERILTKNWLLLIYHTFTSANNYWGKVSNFRDVKDQLKNQTDGNFFWNNSCLDCVRFILESLKKARNHVIIFC